eukprot:gnl/MRDRNA2_/MRDRNA2_93431_c0_seq1.p1 gnl/MRDRNA2_/MRDRNA2_93431_c0~~gnl/MRDRNA2_/MRDRNA2_93431_c0_seq1.p1  ORF type:complete len:573 (+),score=169.43 gnl/MRDRNA2_/MRDRNA2_93431_c0_seq1:58-1776(+)
MSCKGKVKRFNAARGFGFIADPKGSDDIFLHEKYCVDGKQPQKGDIVSFDKEKGQPGQSCRFEARNVTGGTGAPVVQAVDEESGKSEVCKSPPIDNGNDKAESAMVEDTSSADGQLSSAGYPVQINHKEGSIALKADLSIDEVSMQAKKSACAGEFDSMNAAYDELGSDGYFKTHGDRYTNPHEPAIARALLTALDKWCLGTGRLGSTPLRRVHDLACGSGEVAAAFGKWPGSSGCTLDASDPYTYAAFEKRMGKPAYQWSFEDVAGGVLEDLQPYDLVISSFSLHLLDKSFHHMTLAALARSCRALLVLTPHKRPVIEPSTGWTQVEELLQDRVRVRLYISNQARRLEQGETVDHCDYTIVCDPKPEPKEEQAVDSEEKVESIEDVKEMLKNMNQYELREALIKRGLSTAGKRSEWGDRLITAVMKANGCEVGGSQSGESQETDEVEKLEEIQEEEQEGSTIDDEDSESEDGSDEDEKEEESEEEDEEAREMAARRAAVKAALVAKKQEKKAKRGGAAAATAQAQQQQAKSQQVAKKKKEDLDAAKAANEGEKVKRTDMQANFGQTKFIKP